MINMLKHLDFQLIIDSSQKEIENNKKLKINAVSELKKVEQEIAFLLSKMSS